MNHLNNRVDDSKETQLEKTLVDESLLLALDIDLIEQEDGKEEMPTCNQGCKCCGGSATISYKLSFLSKRR